MIIRSLPITVMQYRANPNFSHSSLLLQNHGIFQATYHCKYLQQSDNGHNFIIQPKNKASHFINVQNGEYDKLFLQVTQVSYQFSRSLTPFSNEFQYL